MLFPPRFDNRVDIVVVVSSCSFPACTCRLSLTLNISINYNLLFQLSFPPQSSHYRAEQIMQCIYSEKRGKMNDVRGDIHPTYCRLSVFLSLEPFQSHWQTTSSLSPSERHKSSTSSSQWNDNIQSDTCKNAVGFFFRKLSSCCAENDRGASERETTAIYLSSNCHSHKMINSLLGGFQLDSLLSASSPLIIHFHNFEFVHGEWTIDRFVHIEKKQKLKEKRFYDLRWNTAWLKSVPR